jgi:hypothetical protein
MSVFTLDSKSTNSITLDNKTSGTNSYLTKEDGGYLLQENGGKLILSLGTSSFTLDTKS